MRSVIKPIINNKINRWAAEFGVESAEIFNKSTDSYHSLEFGKYREKCTREFLRSFLTGKFEIGNGFIVNHEGEVSTEIDIIVYEKNKSFLVNDDKNVFYAVEPVWCIGEVKSDLSKEKLTEALVKLAKNKKIQHKRYHPLKSYEQTLSGFSILICKKMKFNIDKVNFEEMYNVNGIEKKYRHNLILSLDDGLFWYQQKVKDGWIRWYLPIGRKKVNDSFVPATEDNEHILSFVWALMQFTAQNLDLGFTDPTHYIFDSKDIVKR